MKRRFILAVLLAVFAFLPSLAHAGTITIGLGVISFDNFLPASSTPGTNAFNLTNLTGDQSNPPDFPVADAVTFMNASFVLALTGGGSNTVSLGDVGPGPLLDSGGNPLFVLQFPDTTSFDSATFSGTLSETTFMLTDGTTVTLIGSPTISAEILPSMGSTLTPSTSGTPGDFAVITVQAMTGGAAVPEPASVVLLGAGLIALCGCARRRRKDRAVS